MSAIAAAALVARCGSAADRPTVLPERWGGIAVALWSSVRPLVPLALWVTLLPACITENNPIVPPASFAASIESTETATHSLNRVISFVPTEAADGGTTDFQPFDLDVVVRDPDVDQDLEWRMYVDDRRGGGDDGDRIAPVSSGDRRLRTISIPTNEVLETLRLPGCHRVEVLVSEAFLPASPRPVTEGDLGTAVWWVATAMNDGDVVDMTGCPR